MDKPSTFKLRLIASIEIAPSFLISKIREIRNRLEHEYKLPQRNDVKEAIEVAELFIDATRHRINEKSYSGYKVLEKIPTHKRTQKTFERHFYIELDGDKKELYIYLEEENRQIKVRVGPKDKSYLYLIKAATSQNYNYIVKALGVSINSKYIEYKII